MAKDSRPWIKLSTDFVRHPKVKALPDRARWALLELWCYAMEYQTDGFIDAADMPGVVRKQHRETLERAGFLIPVTDAGPAEILRAAGVGNSKKTRAVFGKFSDENTSSFETKTGWVLHDYLGHQSSAAELDAKKQQSRSAGRKGGQAKAAKARGEHRETPSGPLQKTSSGRSSENVADIDIDKELQPSNAAASSYVTRENEHKTQQQQPPSTTFADGTPIPPEPDHDDRGTHLALVVDDAPTVIETSARPQRTQPTPAAGALVRLTVGTGIPRDVQRQLAEQVTRLSNDRNVDRVDIEAGLVEWAHRPGSGPRLLPHLVADAARARTNPAPANPTGAVARGNEWIDAGERAAQMLEANQPPRRELT